MKDNIVGFTNVQIIDKEAAEWILLIEDTPELSAEQIKALNEWVGISEVHKTCLKNMANSWTEMDLLSDVLFPHEIQEKETSLNFRVFNPLLALMSFLKLVLSKTYASLRPVYVLPVILCVFTLFIINAINPIDNSLVFVTQKGQKLNHKLNDGTVLWLNSNTKVIVDYSKGFRRINLVRGEAHFEVAKDVNRPFEVFAKDRVVRAVGTAFSVHKLNNIINVLVSEGTVDIVIIDSSLVIVPNDLKKDKKSHIDDLISLDLLTNEENTPSTKAIVIKKKLGLLRAGQRVSIPLAKSEIGNIVKLDSKDISRHLSWKKGKLIFAGELLTEVITEINRHTEVVIDIKDPKLNTIRIGGQFQVGETDTFLHILESGFGVRVIRLNEHYVQLELKNNSLD